MFAESGFSQFARGISAFVLLMAVPHNASAENSLETRARKGDAEAQYELGHAYDYDPGIGHDSAEAIEWYERAASQGHTEAMSALGLLFSGVAGPDGPVADPPLSCSWYEKAALKGHAGAALSLGECFESGRGLPKNYKEAFRWYKFAAEGRYIIGPLNLARLYFSGRGVTRDPVEGYGWAALLAGDGNLAARWLLEEQEARMTQTEVEKGQVRAKELLVQYGHPFHWGKGVR